MDRNPAIEVARKGALAYVGAIAMTGDTIRHSFDRLAKRGARVEKAARAKLQPTAEGVRADVEGGKEKIVEESKERIAEARGVFEQARDRLIDMLHLPTQTSVELLNGEVAHLSAEIDKLRAATRRQAKAVQEAQGAVEPTPGYDKLNVEHAVELLSTLPESKLLAVRNYEQTHSNRVTVLRAIDKLLEPKAEA
jgi:poly(hydroxyalkanoate) granule-associated protein